MIRKLIFGALALLMTCAAVAQTVPGAANYSWTLPTTGCTVGVTTCDNKPLTGADALTGLEIFISTSAIPDAPSGNPTLTLGPGQTTTTYTTTVPNGSTIYMRMRAVNSTGKSILTNAVTKVVNAGVIPGVPTNVTVTFQIQVP